MPTGRRRPRGFALVTALWALVVIGALGVQLHLLARSDRGVAANVRAGTRARWLAREGFALAMEDLDRALRAGTLRPAGDTLLPPLAVERDGIALRVAVTDARARLQLNRADAAELRILLESLSVPPAEAASLADEILAWRDEAPFDRVEELLEVRGMSTAAYARLGPHLTTAGDGRVNVNSAAEPVLRTLPGMDEEGARLVVARRRRAPFRNVFELLAALPAPTQARMQARLGALVERAAFSPREVEIAVESRPRGTPLTAALHAVVALRGGATHTLLGVRER